MPIVTLKKPVVLADGRQFAVIDIPEPTLGGIAAHEMAMVSTQSDTAAMVMMLVAETGWPIEAVQKIASSELEGLAAILRPFEDARPTSEIGGP